MPISEKLKWLRVSSLRVYRVLTWVVVGAGFAFAVIVLSLRYWVLPNIGQYREDIARAVSQAANQRVTIGKISASWDGMRPELVLEGVTVYDDAGRPALELPRVDNTLSWLSLGVGGLRFHQIEFHQPTLNVRRDADGTVWVAGIALARKPEEGEGVVDWLLRQREIVVRDATLSWSDEMRGAPLLDLTQVQLRLANRSERHRFGLRAVAPPHLAGTLDIRGDLAGETVKILSDWNGRFFMQLDYADIAAWRAWVPFPVEFSHGSGALRLWLGFSHNQLNELTADVRLADVRSRLAKDLQELELARLAGRIAWKTAAGEEVFSTTGLELATQDGLALQPLNFLLRLVESRDGRPARGELQANALELPPLVSLTDRLPLARDFRKRLTDFAPQGSLYDVALRWSGDWREPAHYSVRGRFRDLAIKRSDGVPGVTGISGNIDGNEKGGTVFLNTGGASLDMPLVFRAPLQFDAFAAQLAWSRSGPATEFKASNISFSNQHVAGTLFGTYRFQPGSAGTIDLTANATRADARFISRYLPLGVGKATRDWVERAVIGGQSSEVALRLKGDLEDFPFADGKNGVFQVTAKVTGGVLDYAAGWPKLENIVGELHFRGKRMDVFARQATILGVKLAKIHAEIPDLLRGEELLRVSGEAEGPTGEFLAFIEKSPVNDMIDRFTEGLRAQGNGKLVLRLEIPLRAAATSKVAGSYQFINNVISSGELPPLEQVNGRLEFTEASVRVQNATGLFLGGPASLSAVTQRDATVRVSLQGRANIDNLRRAGGMPVWAQSLRGTTDWRGTFVVRKNSADFVVESGLQGIASELPAPFSKSAAESVPLRYERKVVGPQQERIMVSYGEVLNANLLRRLEGERSVIRRGSIRFGGGAAPPERDGVTIGGALQSLDLDRWLAFADSSDGMPVIEFAGVDIRIETLDAYQRRFHDVALNGTLQSGVWRLTVAAREFEGSAGWQPQGRGKLTARLRKLVIPAAEDAAAVRTQAAPERKRELPALDIVADGFQVRGRQLGRLELVAVSGDRDWRIEKLRISNPDGAFTADGAWQNWPGQSRTQLDFQFNVNNIGKMLARFAYPEGVRNGVAKLHGTLAWPGAPQDFDYPALSGNLVVEATKGQFVKLEPGIGKLLGILSLQALPRRVTLDFRDIFSEGFAFDEILGGVNISRGIATTENFRIRGPAASVAMHGEIDLVRETQKLRVRITPSLSDSVSVAGALIGGPVAGVAAFLAQKVLKDPLDQIVSYEYEVTGTWADPLVSKIERKGESQEEKTQ
ncbi:MAG: YhdP family protein [Burkholderiales bacterium]